MTREERQAWIGWVSNLVIQLMDTKQRKVKTKAQLAKECNARFYFIRKNGEYRFPDDWCGRVINGENIKEAVELINATGQYFIQVNKTPPGYKLIWGRKNNTPDICSAVENVEHQKHIVGSTIESQILLPITLTINTGIPMAYEQSLIATKREAENYKKKLCDTKPLESGLRAIEECKNLHYEQKLVPIPPSEDKEQAS